MRPSLFKLEAIFEQYEHVPGMYVLGASDVKSLKLEELFAISNRSIDLHSIELGYCDVKGDESLRDSVTRLYPGSGISVDNVLITIGGSEAIFLALQTLIHSGDEALVCRPAYQALYETAKASGARLSFYDYEEQNGFAPRLDVVKRALARPNPPKVFVVNTPHNPTGHAMDQTALKELLDRATLVGTQVVADEAFLEISLDHASPPASILSYHPEAIVIGCLSKTYGLAGLRIGWLIGPRQFIQQCKNLRYYTSLCPPTIVQQLAEIALRDPQPLLDRSRKIVSENYSYALEWLHLHEDFFQWVRPQAGLFMLLRLKLLVDTEAFTRDLAEKVRVFLLPCTAAFEMKQGYLRLGLGADPEKFKEGLRILSDYLKSRYEGVERQISR